MTHHRYIIISNDFHGRAALADNTAGYDDIDIAAEQWRRSISRHCYCGGCFGLFDRRADTDYRHDFRDGRGRENTVTVGARQRIPEHLR